MIPLRAQWPSSTPKARGGRVSASWALRGRRGRAGPAAPGPQTAEPHSTPGLLGTARGELALALAPASRALDPKVPRLRLKRRGPGGWGGVGRGGGGTARTLFIAFFGNIFWISAGEEAHPRVLKKELWVNKPYLLLPFFSPFSACHTLLFAFWQRYEGVRGERTQLSWQLPTLPYSVDQWGREQEGGGGTGQCIGQRRGGRDVPLLISLLAPNSFLS